MQKESLKINLIRIKLKILKIASFFPQLKKFLY